MASSVSYIEGTKQLILLILLIVSTLVSWHYATALVSRVRPTFYLDDDIHISSLNNPLDSTRIYFHLKIKNENNLVGLYYDDPLNLVFTYFPPTNSTTKNPEAAQVKYRIGGFYQGNGKVKDVQDFVVVKDLFPNDRREIEETSGSWIGPVKVMDLRVDLDGKLNFKSIENKEIDLIAGVTVEINSETGLIVQNQTIKLDYASGSDSWGFLQWLMFFALFILFNSISSAVFSKHAPSYISQTLQVRAT